MRKPDYIIGPANDPYLRRWYVIPRNRWFNIYLHNFVRGDKDEALHDHPWWNISIVLKGGYWEEMPKLAASLPLAAFYQPPHQFKWRGPGSIVLRKPTDAHRVRMQTVDGPVDGWGDPLDDDEMIESWSIFITGPVVREWGFWCKRGWVPFKEFIKLNRQGNERGSGCNED